MCYVRSNPLSLEVFETMCVYFVYRMTHIGYYTTVLEPVHVFSTYYMFVTWRGRGGRGRGRERRGRGEEEEGRRKRGGGEEGRRKMGGKRELNGRDNEE